MIILGNGFCKARLETPWSDGGGGRSKRAAVTSHITAQAKTTMTRRDVSGGGSAVASLCPVSSNSIDRPGQPHCLPSCLPAVSYHL